MLQAFVTLAGVPPDGHRNDDDHLLWGRLVDCCVALLDISDAAVFLLDDAGRLQLAVSTRPPAERIEIVAPPAREAPPRVSGPREPVRVEDLISPAAVRARSPRWAARDGRKQGDAAPVIFRPVQALVLRRHQHIVGTLDLCCRQRGGLGVGQAALAQALADVATATMTTRRSLRQATVLNHQLQIALDGRVIIEQAKGILSQRRGITLGESFEVMRHYARHRNLPVREVARRVVEADGAFWDGDPFADDAPVQL